MSYDIFLTLMYSLITIEWILGVKKTTRKDYFYLLFCVLWQKYEQEVVIVEYVDVTHPHRDYRIDHN